jgi:hypothetical protein
LNPKIRKKRDVGRRVRSSCKRGLEIIFQISFFFSISIKKTNTQIMDLFIFKYDSNFYLLG